MSAPFVVERNVDRRFPRGDFNGNDGAWFPHREVACSDRGAVIRLRRNERVVVDGREFDGADFRGVEVRRWHDGSLTIEREYDR